MTEVEPYLISTVTDRGFKHMPPIGGAYSASCARVYESSSASGPHLWLQMNASTWPGLACWLGKRGGWRHER